MDRIIYSESLSSLCYMGRGIARPKCTWLAVIYSNQSSWRQGTHWILIDQNNYLERESLQHMLMTSHIGFTLHYDDVTMNGMASQITSLTIVYSTVYPGVDQRKHQSLASLAFVRGIHRRPMNSPHKCPVTRKLFPFDDVIMICGHFSISQYSTPIAGAH